MDDRLLRAALTTNALLSGVAGIGTAALAGMLDDLLGIPAPLLVAAGVALVPWSVALWWARSRETLLRREAVTAIAGDAVWVLASAIVLALSPGGLSTADHWAIGVTALAVGDLAAVQAIGLRRLGAGAVSPTTPRGRRPAAP